MQRRRLLTGLSGTVAATTTLAATATLGATASLAGCLGFDDGSDAGDGRPMPADGETGLELASSAFEDGGTVPRTYTCDGEDGSPPLAVAGVPDGAASLALVVDDPDAPSGTFVHWLLWNVPPDTAELPAGVPTGETVGSLDGAAQGTNDFGSVGYGGPCPPSGERHTYRFDLFALDATLDVDPGSEVGALGSAIDGQVVGSTRLTADYERG